VLAILAFSGCMAYQPYGYGGAYTVPGGTYVPQQGPMMAPTPAATLQPAPQAYSESPTLQPTGQTFPSGQAFPPSEQSTVSAPSRPLPDSLGDTGVPEPRPRPSPPTNSLTEDGADDIMQPTIDPTGAQLLPPGVENLVAEETVATPSLIDDGSIAEPGRLDRRIGTSSLLTQDDPSPYAFDEEKFTWLRGLVDFNDREGVYRVQYGTDPTGDQYSGVLTLAPDPRLENLLIGDIVLVRGRVDVGRRDFNGKPVFVILSEDEETDKLRGVMKLQPKRRGPRPILD
jgi:hypothetical protein